MRITILVAALVAACPAHAQKAAPPPATADTQDNYQPAKRDTLACEGPFARDTSHAKLVTAFGQKNVRQEDRSTVLFDDDPTRRIVVFWHDEKARARPLTITVTAPSLWIGPAGVGNGMKLTDVEKLNGKPFKLNGFGREGGGYARELDGKLKPSGCNLGIRFEPGIANPLPARYAEITGEDKVIVSNNKLLRRTRSQVAAWEIVYPK